MGGDKGLTEAQILQQCRLKASECGARVFRNNSGSLKDSTGRWVQFGLCVGSSDLIGWVPVTITQDMVGKTFARFLAIECKTSTGRLTSEQRQFLDLVEQHGGIGVMVRDAGEIVHVLQRPD